MLRKPFGFPSLNGELANIAVAICIVERERKKILGYNKII